MKFYILLISVVATAHSNPADRAAGWGWPSTTTKAPGWGSTTTKGWGWSTTPGWSVPSLSIADLTAQLAAAGSGWAAENHQDSVQVLGGDGVNAELVVSSGGDSIIDQGGDITQVTQGEPHLMSAINLAGLSQLSGAGENSGVIATGLNAILAQSGWAASDGEGTSGADALTFAEATKNAKKE